MKYDHPEYHWNNDFPSDLPDANAITHMGFFFAWALTRGLVSDSHRADEELAESLERVRNRQMSPRQYVITFCDSQLTNEDFTKTGNAFAGAYYIQHFLNDYRKTFEHAYATIYHVEDSWTNADVIFRVLDGRFEKWKKHGEQQPWWKFFKTLGTLRIRPE